jgi:uncharacterized protein YjeT (DUF2065 family)
MRALKLAGLAIAVAGVFGLVLEHLVLAGEPEVIRAGSITVLARSDPLPTIVGVLAIVIGVGLVWLARLRRNAAPTP